MSKSKNNQVRAYAKYSGMAFQLFGLLAVTVFLGMKADEYFGFTTNYLTATFSILVLFAYFYKLVKVTSNN